MTFEEWKTAFISNERPEMIEMFKVAWNAGQLAMRERAANGCEEISYPVDIEDFRGWTKKEHASYACNKCAEVIRRLAPE